MAKNKFDLEYLDDDWMEDIDDLNCNKKDIQRIISNQRKKNRDRRNNKNKKMNNLY